jgi:hypothetical protein
MLTLSNNRLKKTYLKYAREIQGTGEGVKRTDGEHANLIGKSTSQSRWSKPNRWITRANP